MSIHVQLEQFEGPLGLLLYLIKKEEMDISNIQIHKITSQYLEYIRMMKDFDLEVAGDFVAMAATLIQIKSRLLLPQYNDAGEAAEEAEDPRKELVNRLLEYQKYQEASKKLNELPLLNRDVFPRGNKETYEEGVEEIQLEDNALYQMISLYRVALMKMKRRVHKVYAKGQSIASRILEIKDRILPHRQTEMRELLIEGEHTRTKLLITFLSLLELTRLGFVSIFQSDVYTEIFVSPKKEIASDVVSRVQEYDTKDAEAVASSWIQKSNEDASAGATLHELSFDDAEVQMPTTNAQVHPQFERPAAARGVDPIGEAHDRSGDAESVDVDESNERVESVDVDESNERVESRQAPALALGSPSDQISDSEERTWEDDVVDQLGNLSDADFETFLNVDERSGGLAAAAPQDLSIDLEEHLEQRTLREEMEDLAQPTEYELARSGIDFAPLGIDFAPSGIDFAPSGNEIARFAYEGSLDMVATPQAEPFPVDAANTKSGIEPEDGIHGHAASEPPHDTQPESTQLKPTENIHLEPQPKDENGIEA